MFAIVNDIHTCMFFEVVNREYQCIMMGFWLIYWLRCPVNHEIGAHVNYVCSYWMCSNAGVIMCTGLFFLISNKLVVAWGGN